MKSKPTSRLPSPWPALLFVIGFRALVLFYWFARYGGNWAEDDEARTTASIDAVFHTGALVPQDRFLYANGFLYQVLGTVMARFTGVSVVDVQRWLMPILGITLTIVAFAFYLRIFRNPSLAAATTILLNIQGDFVYATLRSSHEKIDFLLIFVSLLVLVLSVQWFESWRERVSLAAVYYLFILAENTNNVFFASTFTITLILSFLFWYSLTRYVKRRLVGVSWVIAVAAAALLITFILVVFVYPIDASTTSETLVRTSLKWILIFFAIFMMGLLTVFFIQGWHWREVMTEAAGASWLLYVAIVSIVFVFIVVFVWYSPARSVVAVTGDITERIRLFMVSPVSAPGGLLQIVSASWVLPNAWLWLRIYDIVILLVSGIGWIYMFLRLRHTSPDTLSPVNSRSFWLLILLPAFALQNMLFVLSDLTGSAGDINNLQIRLIPFTALVAIPTAVYTLTHFLRWLQSYRPLYRLMSLGIMMMSAVALLLGLIKGTSEPFLSNTWFFYAPAERASLVWLNNSMPQFDFELGRRTPTVWTGPDFRIGRLWREQFWGSSRNTLPLASSLDAPYTYILITPGIRLLSERYSQPVPDLQGAGLIYDNGTAKIYYRFPERAR